MIIKKKRILIFIKYEEILKIIFFIFDKKITPDPEAYPLFPEMDPRIRIKIKMKWIRNTDKNELDIFKIVEVCSSLRAPRSNVKTMKM